MIRDIFTTVVYEPIYNILVGLLDVLPWADLGIVIILVTLLIKLILSPLSIKAVRTQVAMKAIEPKIKEVQAKYKDDRQEQALKLMELYRENNIKPFSGFVILLVQIPVILGLYYVILRGGFPAINPDILYPFIPTPPTIDIQFLGAIDVTAKSIVLSLLTGISQFAQMRLAFPKKKEDEEKKSDTPDFKADFSRMMGTQMRYVFPVFVAIISYTLSAAIALYWMTSNLFHIAQELYVRKHIKKTE